MPSYADPKYWDERYAGEDGEFDWYTRYDALVPIIDPLIQPDARVLVLGCGNSSFSADMYSAGFHNVVNIDISGVCITQMKLKYQAMDKMEWHLMDCQSLDFKDDSFDLVIDKGTMDAVLCGDGSFEKVYKTHQEALRVLKPGGSLVVITYGDPKSRMHFFTRTKLNWDVEHTTLPRESVSPDPEVNCYHVYIMTKRPKEDNSVEVIDVDAEDSDDEFCHRVLLPGKARVGQLAGIFIEAADVPVTDLPSLVSLLNCGTPELEEQSATVLLSLALNTGNASDIVAAGAVGPLIVLLVDGTPIAAANAAAVLGNLAMDREGAAAVMEGGAAVPLIKLLSKGTVEATEHAAAALANLAADECHAAEIVAAEGIPPLVHLLLVGTAEGQEAAVGTLSNLAADLASAEAIAAAGAIGPLVGLLRTGNFETQSNAIGLLQTLACLNVVHQDAIIKEGAIPALMGLLHSDKLEIVGGAVAALASLVDSQSFDPNFAAVLPAIENLLHYGTPAAQSNASWALAKLAKKPEFRSHASSDIILLLISLLTSDAPAVACQAVDTLAALAGADIGHLQTLDLNDIHSWLDCATSVQKEEVTVDWLTKRLDELLRQHIDPPSEPDEETGDDLVPTKKRRIDDDAA